ncbi:hypothetical protein CYL31_19065 [Marinomonas sp. A3A]|uniref:hypothetical protein n=1 Tax=Marinomonas sp. A3A TaxID=2065312 RepID=UPI001BB35701|nr:hypothetical protein [Marinomonas sp. A3A]QUX93372.1 hypothetical protein CYL31_19065 [Marinomonas sp. A3A]
MTSIISAITGYIIVVSTFYLMGYWTEFGINHLEYITISEVAVVALNSILASFGFIALGSLLSYIYLGNIFKVGEGKYTPEGKFINKWWKLIAFPFVILAVYAIYTDKPLAMYALALIFAPIIGIWIGNQGFLEGVIKNPEIRFSVINMAVVVIFLSHPKGFLDAYARKNDSDNHQVLIENIQYTYIGRLGDNLFLYQEASKNIIQFTPVPKKIKYLSNKSSKKDAEIITSS